MQNTAQMARPRLNRKVVRISVSLDEQMYADVYALASQSDVPVAWMIRRAVSELIDRRKDELLPQLPLIPSGSGGARSA